MIWDALYVKKTRKIGVYAGVPCELNTDDVTFIPGKSRIFYVQSVCPNSNVNIYFLSLLESKY